MDDFDRATLLEEKFREQAIQYVKDQAVRHARSALVNESSGVFCQNVACGEPIPEARLVAVPGCRFCTECQIRREKALKRKGYAIHA